MPQPLRIGILGAGYMAKVHGTNLNKIDGVEIAAICSFDPALSSTLAQDIGAPNAALFEDFTRMLDESKLDAVCIAVPPFVHKGEVVAAAPTRPAYSYRKTHRPETGNRPCHGRCRSKSRRDLPGGLSISL